MDTTKQTRTRQEMIQQLVNANELRLRDLLTLTPEIIYWLDVMAERETSFYSSLSDDRLVAACNAL